MDVKVKNYPRLDPNQLNLFETLEDEKKHLEEIEAERIEAENQIEENISSRKKTRSNRKLLEGLPGASLLSEIMLGKYEYHLPFYRQVKQLHHLGVKIPANTLSGWFKPTCELLSPLYKVLKKEVLETDYIQVDETTLPVINKESHYAKKEYLWMVRSVMKKLVFFHYDEGSRSGGTAYSLLKSFDGYLQSDGFSSYNVFESNEKVCLVSCMAHIRRYYETALDENRSLAEYALKQIQQLYQIERMADEQNLSFDERRKIRNELAGPILLSFEKWKI